VLGVLLISCVAGVVAHIPAGLGVLEAVFLPCSGQLGQGTLIAALLGYRTLYYLIPLLLAVVTYLFLEKRARPCADRPGRSSTSADGPRMRGSSPTTTTPQA
jgi:uncharacterized membrane protein YbhN (UPF0104 family)